MLLHLIAKATTVGWCWKSSYALKVLIFMFVDGWFPFCSELFSLGAGSFSCNCCPRYYLFRKQNQLNLVNYRLVVTAHYKSGFSIWWIHHLWISFLSGLHALFISVALASCPSSHIFKNFMKKFPCSLWKIFLSYLHLCCSFKDFYVIFSSSIVSKYSWS